MESLYLSGGCFWGMEDLFLKENGIVNTVVGYTGGHTPNPTYNEVKTGETGHAEALKIDFDPQQTDIKKIFHFFFAIHDPTTVNRQGNDRGTQYRSAIFYQNEEEQAIAETVIDEISLARRWPRPIVTTLEPFQKFYPAEDFHQKYLKKNPGGYTCHWQRYRP